MAFDGGAGSWTGLVTVSRRLRRRCRVSWSPSQTTTRRSQSSTRCDKLGTSANKECFARRDRVPTYNRANKQVATSQRIPISVLNYPHPSSVFQRCRPAKHQNSSKPFYSRGTRFHHSPHSFHSRRCSPFQSVAHTSTTTSNNNKTHSLTASKRERTTPSKPEQHPRFPPL